VDLIVIDKGPPADLELDELNAYYTAGLAAQRVKLDMWRFLTGFWAETWGEAMKAMPAATLLNFGGHSDVFALSPTLGVAWSDRQTYGVHKLPGDVCFATGVFLVENDQRVELAFSMFTTGGVELTLAFAPSIDWRVNEERWTVFRPPHVKLRDNFEIELAPFKACADEIVQLLIDQDGVYY
jgi:hypothetical protein